MGDQDWRQAADLRGDALDEGWKAVREFEFTGEFVAGATTPAERQRIEAAWRAGFATGWAAREVRDDEPELHEHVWLRDNRGGRYVAHRPLARNDDGLAAETAVWLVSGRAGWCTWIELLEDAAEWGRLTKGRI